MAFSAFEEYSQTSSGSYTHGLASGESRLIKGKYIFFNRIEDGPGEGSPPHYHPNEKFIFVITGKINALVGDQRRIVTPGTFIHVPFRARHQMRATEDGPASYIYMKDGMWELAGIRAEEPLPDGYPILEDILDESRNTNRESTTPTQNVGARLEGLGNCFYPTIETLHAPCSAGLRNFRLEGPLHRCGLSDLPAGHRVDKTVSTNEQFYCLLGGTLDFTIDAERKQLQVGGIAHIPIGSNFSYSVSGSESVRYVMASSKKSLETIVDNAAAEA